VPPRRVLKEVYEIFGKRCAMPDCPYPNTMPDQTPILEIAHIVPMTQGGTHELSNLLILCPNHHLIIDRDREQYTVEKLRNIRKMHLEQVASGNIPSTIPDQSANFSKTASRLEDSLQLWAHGRRNSSEEYWQRTFAERPELLMSATQGRAFSLSSKCYVGGKAIDNRGGGVLDFLAQHSTDAVLVEIKTPITRLMGGQYRDGVYSPSHELSGSVVQALNYRNSLLSDLYSLRSHTPSLTVCSPSIFVLIGDAERESLSGAEIRSFELFRTALKDVVIQTYDELFSGIEALTVFLEPKR
jgi:Domain of unknown function (DUF4263)/HNH endonuclease